MDGMDDHRIVRKGGILNINVHMFTKLVKPWVFRPLIFSDLHGLLPLFIFYYFYMTCIDKLQEANTEVKRKQEVK